MKVENLRVGNGFDVHAFGPNRNLIIGGVNIPYNRGLVGHSDADVLLHAIIDALLGATAKGDIGKWFPDTDAEYKNIDSKILFERVWNSLQSEGWQLINCDSVIMAQQPKFSPHLESIRESIAGLFSSSKEAVSVKATTTERLGFVGREEGIAVSSVVLLAKVN